MDFVSHIAISATSCFDTLLFLMTNTVLSNYPIYINSQKINYEKIIIVMGHDSALRVMFLW